MKKGLALVLVLAMLAALLVGCKTNGTTSDGTGTGTAPASSDATETGTDSGEESADDRDTLGNKQFNSTYRILTRTSTSYEFESANGVTGDQLDQAVFRRNEAVKERFAVDIKVTSIPGEWADRGDFMASVRAEHQAPTADYSVISTHSAYLAQLAAEGIAVDLASLPNVDLNKVWWCKSLLSSSVLGDKAIFAIGDLTSTLYEYMEVMFVNETKFASLHSDDDVDLYALVEDGDWTWEKYTEFAKQFGTGNSDGGDGNFGALTNVHAWRAALIGQDITIAQRNTDTGRYETPKEPSSKLIDTMNDMIKFYNLDNIFFSKSNGTDAGYLNPIFSAGQALFYGQTLGEAKNLKGSMSDDFGIVPIPKYDEFQETYQTQCRDTLSAIMVLNTVKDPEMVGTITEAMSMYGHQIIVPAYYEVALKYQYFDNPKYSAVLDTIRNGLTFDYAFVYISFDTNPYDYMGRSCIYNNGATQPYTKYSEKATEWQTLLTNLYKSFEEKGLLDRLS